MLILNPTSAGFWEQNQVSLTIILTFLLVVCIGIFSLLFAKRIAIGNLLRSNLAQNLLAWLPIIVVIASGITLVLSFMPKVYLDMGGLALFLLWPLLVVQIIVGCLPWRKFLSTNPAVGFAVLVIYVWWAVSVAAAVLKLTGYAG